MTPSRPIVDSFTENLNLIQLRRFKRSVLIPQRCVNLLAAADEAEKILIERENGKKKEVQVEKEEVPAILPF